MLKRFLRDESGATAVEYGIIVTTISLIMFAALGNAFDAIERMFADNSSKLNTALQ